MEIVCQLRTGRRFEQYSAVVSNHGARLNVFADLFELSSVLLDGSIEPLMRNAVPEQKLDRIQCSLVTFSARRYSSLEIWT